MRAHWEAGRRGDLREMSYRETSRSDFLKYVGGSLEDVMAHK